MLLAHRIRLDPTAAQRDYFARAAGTARRVWNWALAEWLRQVHGGGKPNALALKKQFNAIKYTDPEWLDENGQPWLRTIHRDAHAQPFAHLGKAWSRYVEQRRAGEKAYPPRFRKKGRCAESFYLANDKFRLEGLVAVLPKSAAWRWSRPCAGRAGSWARACRAKPATGFCRSRSRCRTSGRAGAAPGTASPASTSG